MIKQILSYLGSFDINYVIFKNVEILENMFSKDQKFVKEIRNFL
jgi:hypothetical protein